MSWEKLGLVFEAAKHARGGWFLNSALTPQPFRLDKETIRVYAGFRDAEGVSRIGFADVDQSDPRRILRVSAEPVLDIGRDGCFDDNGVILGDVTRGPDGIYMFYVGFQLVKKAKFLAFSGVAKSDDGVHFHRLSESPILDRAPHQSTIGAIHTALYENGKWRLWFAQGDDWERIDGKQFPRYHIRYTEGDDLFNLPRSSALCVPLSGDEYRIGRPKVYRLRSGGYLMYATKGTPRGDYTPSLFRSSDGIAWVRDDAALGISMGHEGWDSRTLCYPALVACSDKVLMFYNGNGMGVDGFGAAVTSRDELQLA